MSVLDLIDGAIEQYDDAMRWSPPERHAEVQSERLRQAVASFGRTMSAFSEEFAASLKRAVDGFNALGLRLTHPTRHEVAIVSDERLARLSSMRSAYRRRRG